MDWLSTIIGALLAGIIIGPLARLVLPGKQNISIGMTILIGAVGALVGGLVADWLNIGQRRAQRPVSTGSSLGFRWSWPRCWLSPTGRWPEGDQRAPPRLRPHPRQPERQRFGQTSSRTRSMTSSSMS